MSRPFSNALLVSMLLASPALAADDAQSKREQQFAEKLTGSTLVGSFTVEGQDKPPQEDRYEIEKVEKTQGDRTGKLWTLHTRIKYGENDVRAPVTVPVLWAGDTPVITVDNLMIPGLGTFDARVLFHGDRYVGTWQHGEVGGHMWGMIEKSSGESK